MPTRRTTKLGETDGRVALVWEEQRETVDAVRKGAYPEGELERLERLAAQAEDCSYHGFRPAEAFCVETARWLLNVAQQAYRDWPGEARSDALPELDVAQFGFDVVARFRDIATDTRAIVVRHRRTRRLVVAFRGTKSKAHFKTDLKYTLKAVNASLLMPWGKEESLPQFLRAPMTAAMTRRRRLSLKLEEQEERERRGEPELGDNRSVKGGDGGDGGEVDRGSGKDRSDDSAVFGNDVLLVEAGGGGSDGDGNGRPLGSGASAAMEAASSEQMFRPSSQPLAFTVPDAARPSFSPATASPSAPPPLVSAPSGSASAMAAAPMLVSASASTSSVSWLSRARSTVVGVLPRGSWSQSRSRGQSRSSGGAVDEADAEVAPFSGVESHWWPQRRSLAWESMSSSEPAAALVVHGAAAASHGSEGVSCIGDGSGAANAGNGAYGRAPARSGGGSGGCSSSIALGAESGSCESYSGWSSKLAAVRPSRGAGGVPSKVWARFEGCVPVPRSGNDAVIGRALLCAAAARRRHSNHRASGGDDKQCDGFGVDGSSGTTQANDAAAPGAMVGKAGKAAATAAIADAIVASAVAEKTTAEEKAATAAAAVEEDEENMDRVARQAARLRKHTRSGMHQGFFEAYCTLRERIHAVVADELLREPAELFFTGHSLGGALATIASYDCALHLLPRLDDARRARAALRRAVAVASAAAEGAAKSAAAAKDAAAAEDIAAGHNTAAAAIGAMGDENVDAAMVHACVVRGAEGESADGDGDGDDGGGCSSGNASGVNAASTTPGGHEDGGSASTGFASDDLFDPSPITMGIYTFGCPKVGNAAFAAHYDALVPHCFRVVVDGDIIAGVPPNGYAHVGVLAVTDKAGAGHLILNPAPSEYRYRTSRHLSIDCHMFHNYIRGVEGLMRPFLEAHEQQVIAKPWASVHREEGSVSGDGDPAAAAAAAAAARQGGILRRMVRKLCGQLAVPSQTGVDADHGNGREATALPPSASPPLPPLLSVLAPAFGLAGSESIGNDDDNGDGGGGDMEGGTASGGGGAFAATGESGGETTRHASSTQCRADSPEATPTEVQTAKAPDLAFAAAALAPGDSEVSLSSV